MKSPLTVNGCYKDNYKNETEHRFDFKREKGGKYELIDIYCSYDTGYNVLYLKICLQD